MRVVLAGNNSAAVNVLDLLLEFGPADRILCLAPPPTEQASWHQSLAPEAIARGVATLQPADVNSTENIASIQAFEPMLLLSVYYTQIFRRELIESIGGPCINLHPSLLPKHRGVAPLIWAIVDGEATTGVTAHVIDAGIDTGPVLMQRRLPIHPDDTGAELHDKAARLVTAMCAELLRSLRAGVDLSAGRSQTGRATYRDRRVPSVNHLVWSDPRERIRNIVRALAPPLPCAYAFVDQVRFGIVHVEPEERSGRPWRPGALSLVGEVPVVWTGDGALRLVTVDLLDGRGPVPGCEIGRLDGAYEGSLLT